jgi:hypothetical protein
MSVFKEIGEAIVDKLNERSYDLDFTAFYSPRFNLETDITNQFQVVVQPLTRAKQRSTRIDWMDTYTHVVLCVQKMSAIADQLDYQKDLQLSTMDEIEDQIARNPQHKFAGFSLVGVVSEATARSCFSEDLYLRGVFAAATTVTTAGQARTC